MVSGQQQRPPHVQLLRNLGNHRLTGHAAGARGREPGRVQLPQQSRGTTLTPREQEQDLASQQNFLDPLLPVASRAAWQPWHFPVPWWRRSHSVGRFLQTHWDTWMWGASLAWDSSAPLGISAHQPPFPCAHGLAAGAPSQLCPLPTAPCLQFCMVGSASSSCSTPRKGSSHPLVALCNPLCSQLRIPLPHPALRGCFTSLLSVCTSPIPAM